MIVVMAIVQRVGYNIYCASHLGVGVCHFERITVHGSARKGIWPQIFLCHNNYKSPWTLTVTFSKMSSKIKFSNQVWEGIFLKCPKADTAARRVSLLCHEQTDCEVQWIMTINLWELINSREVFCWYYIPLFPSFFDTKSRKSLITWTLYTWLVVTINRWFMKQDNTSNKKKQQWFQTRCWAIYRLNR